MLDNGERTSMVGKAARVVHVARPQPNLARIYADQYWPDLTSSRPSRGGLWEALRIAARISPALITDQTPPLLGQAWIRFPSARQNRPTVGTLLNLDGMTFRIKHCVKTPLAGIFAFRSAAEGDVNISYYSHWDVKTAQAKSSHCLLS